MQECGGLLLDADTDWSVVAMGYRKFFNYGERHAATLEEDFGDEDDATHGTRVYEKRDGSLAKLYSYQGEWHVASNGRPDGAGPMAHGETTFRVGRAHARALTAAAHVLRLQEMFWRIWTQCGYQLPPHDCGLCFMFEMTSPRHPHVVTYAEGACPRPPSSSLSLPLNPSPSLPLNPTPSRSTPPSLSPSLPPSSLSLALPAQMRSFCTARGNSLHPTASCGPRGSQR